MMYWDTSHAESSGKEDEASTEFVNGVKTEEGGGHVDDFGNYLEDEGVGEGTVGILGDVGGFVVELGVVSA